MATADDATTASALTRKNWDFLRRLGRRRMGLEEDEFEDQNRRADLKEGETLLHDNLGATIVRTQSGSLVKRGRRVKIREVRALQLVSGVAIPVPAVVATEPLEQGMSLEMTFIEGDLLEDAWKSMCDQQKDAISAQLRDILKALSTLKSPSGRIESCDGSAVADLRYIRPHDAGPFQTEAEFNAFLLDLPKATPQPVRNAFASKLRTDHEIVLAHGDLSQHNILVKGDQVVGLIDWEYAGYFPAWWDYVKFLERHSPNSDWRDYAHKIFPVCYDDELVTYQALARWQRP